MSPAVIGAAAAADDDNGTDEAAESLQGKLFEVATSLVSDAAAFTVVAIVGLVGRKSGGTPESLQGKGKEFVLPAVSLVAVAAVVGFIFGVAPESFCGEKDEELVVSAAIIVLIVVFAAVVSCIGFGLYGRALAVAIS
jgi:hypothetical protein